MVTVGELRDELVELGMTRDAAEAVVGKSNVQAKVEELRVERESEEILNEVEVDSDEELTSGDSDEGLVETTTEPPEMSDPRWSDYVLSHLEENEKIKGHPKTDSLRRLTELLIGPVIDIDIPILHSPTMDNGNRATVVVKVEVLTSQGITLKASGAADVYPGNTEQLYAKFASATADTRAEGRAYRKILRLINVITAEEVVEEDQIFDPADKIDNAQKVMINQMCSTAKLNIDVEKLLKQHDIDSGNIDNVSRSKAKELCKVINSYQATGVPEALIGYKENWS